MPGELRLKRSFSTILGEHVRWEQVVGGVPVYASEVSVHVGRDGRVMLVNADVFPVDGLPPPPRVTPAEARSAAVEEARDEEEVAVETKEPVLVLLPEAKSARLCWQVDARWPEDSRRLFVDAATGEIAGDRPLRRSADGTGKVFQPNPVFSSQNTGLSDNGDANSAALAAQQATVTIPRLDGTGYLRGDYVDCTLGASDAFSGALSFSYTRDDDRFEQVNAYFHIDAVQAWFQGTLGITDANNRVQSVDAHAIPDDNSYYDGFDLALHFGDGGVDDGEDGDVVAQEYGHAVQDNIVPGFGETNEGGAMGEGFGDYLACTRHESGSAAFDAATASWDATAYSSANPPALRRVDGTKHYPEDIVGEVHDDGEIWSSALWAIRTAIGRQGADPIIVASHFLLTPSAVFSDGAQAILSANETIRGGADATAIQTAFADRGISGGDDFYEPNDSSGAAATILSASNPGLYLGDDDWYAFTVQGGSSVTVTASFLHPNPDLHLYLYSQALTLLDFSDGVSNSESVTTPTPGTNTTYLLHVLGYAGSRGSYDLDFAGGLLIPDDVFEPNDSQAQAASLPLGNSGLLNLLDEDWFVLPVAPGANVQVVASFNGAQEDLDLELSNGLGFVLSGSYGTGSSESVSALATGGAAGSLLLHVHPFAGSGPYTLSVTAASVPILVSRITLLGTLVEGTDMVLGLVVPVGSEGSPVVLKAKAKKRGAIPAVEVSSPEGGVISPLGTGLVKKGSTVKFVALTAGLYPLLLRTLPGTSGSFSIRAVLKKPK